VDFLIELSWHCHVAGYELLPEMPEKPGPPVIYTPGKSLLGDDSPLSEPAKPSRIVPRGEQVRTYRPMEIEGLYTQFASLKSAEDLLSFINRFGPLFVCGEVIVPKILEYAQYFREWLDCGSASERVLAGWAGPEGKEITHLQVYIVQDQQSGEPRFQWRPPHLLSALWLQLMRALMRQRPFRECRYCGTWFEVGPGTLRRMDAKFCKDEHRIFFNRRGKPLLDEEAVP
jgi:hypothetical protein